MNKRCYRLRFNHVRGQWMVVADIVVGLGKNHGGRASIAGDQPDNMNNRIRLARALRPGQGFPTECLRPIARALLLAGAASLIPLLPGSAAYAQIVANKDMPAHTQPAIVTTANGLPQVNIQTPNGAGVSMNNYSQFDVQNNGAILNNSITSTQTQLAGWIQGNPLLHDESARVIVNQIQSADPSRLNGYIEVAGQRAQVIMANPAGISCDGCGFIQADRAVLTTGQVNLNPATGALDNYVVRTGSVNIANMDAGQTPYVDVLARAVKVTGALRAGQLDIKTGVNTIAADTGAVKADAAANDAARREGADAQGDASPVAIDVAELGGMYAGQITLLATEHGVGVRNAGNIHATQGLTLSSDGHLHNRGTLASDAALQVQSGSLRNDGTLYGKTRTIANTVGDLQNNSHILSGGNITLGANGAQGRLQMAPGSQLAAGLDVPDRADGQQAPSVGTADERRLKPGQAITLQATQQATVSGTIQVDGSLLAQADNLSVEGSQISADHIRLHSVQGNLQANNAQIYAQTLAVDTPKQISTEHAHIQANDLQLNAASIRNRQGQIVHTGADPFVLKIGELDNQGGLIAATSANLHIKSDSLDNTDGSVLQTAPTAESATLDVASRKLFNTRGTIRSNKGQVSLTLADNDVLANQAGQIHSGTAMTLRAGGISNQAGQIRAGERLELTLDKKGQGLDNRQGTVSAKNVNVDTGGQALNNAQGTVQAVQALHIRSGEVDNDGGLIQAGQALDMDTAGQRLINTNAGKDKGVGSGGTLQLTVGQLDNRLGFIGAGKAASLRAGQVDNRQGSVVGSDKLDVQATGLDNGEGNVQSVKGMSLNLANAGLDNRSGLIRAGGSLDIHAGAIDNESTFNGDRAAQQQKGIQGGTVSLDGSALNNRNGFVAATLALDFKLSEKIDNQNGFATSLGATRISDPTGALVLNNEQGYISGKAQALVQSAQLAGQGGTFAADQLTLNLKGDYLNTHSLIGHSLLNLSTSGDVHNNATLASTGALTLNARHIQNGQQGQIQARQTRVNAAGLLENQGLINGQDTVVTADQIRNLGSGRIYGQRLGLQARDILNGSAQNGLNQAGTIAAHDRLDIGAQTLTNQDGALIYSGADAAFGSSLDADNHATGTASSIVNNGSIIDIAGSATVHTEKLNNVNADYRTELQQVGPVQKVVEFEPIPEDSDYDPRIHKRYGTDSAVVIDDDKSMLYFAGPPGNLWGIFGQPEAPKVGMRIKWVSDRRGGFPHNYYLDDRWIGLAPSYFISYRDVLDDRPDAHVDRPGAGFGRPGAGSGRHDADVDRPGAGSGRPDADVDRPGSGSGRPGRRPEKRELVYELLYKPDDPIWEKTGIAAPDRNVPEPLIEQCSTGQNGFCQLKPNPAMAEYMKNNPSYDQLNALISQYNKDLQG